MRGDEPTAVEMNEAIPEEFPACAGMNRNTLWMA